MNKKSINTIKKAHPLLGMTFLALMSFFISQAQTWDYKDSGTSFILLDLSIPPGQSDVAYAAGSLYTVNSEGIIIKTIDGGESWETIYPVSGTVPSFTKIEFVTPLKGFAVGWGNTFLITEDGGATWQDVVAGTNVYHYTSLNFYNEEIGFAVALNNSNGVDSYLTNDGGDTWTEGADTSEMAEFAAAYADGTTLFTVGKDQVISKSVDSGENWSVISAGANAMYNFRVFFRDVDNGIVSTEDGTLLTTHDSGDSWDSFSTGYHNFYALNYKGNDIFAGGTDQDVFYSPDNGSNWSMIYDGPPTSTFYQIEFFADDTALICGSGGIMLKATDILGEITVPENDLCENAIAVECGDTVVGDTSTGTDSGGNPTPDLWYSYTGSGEQESVTISLCDGGTDYDSYLRLFDACGGTEIATNDNYCGIWSEISFTSNGTSTYYIMVDGWGTTSSGNFSLAVTCELIGGGNCTEVEYFEDGLPIGWSTVINTGNCDWENKSYLPTGDQFSTLAMVFDDDLCYVDAPASNVTLLSDVYNTNGATSVLLSYDIAFQVSGTLQTATVEVYDGSTWQQVAFYDEDLDPDIQSESIDVSAYANAELQVRWTYDDNDEWAWHLGIDNFCLSHDGVLGIGDNEVEGLSYFPNPTTNIINLIARENIESVVIYNILGQKVVDQNNNAIRIQLNVDHLISGTYIMKVLVNGKTGTYKVVKE